MSDTKDVSSGPGDIASSVFHYPHLEQLLDSQSASSLATRRRLEQTRENLDRVVRSATPEEASQAARVLCAYEVVLSLIAELEQLRNVVNPSEHETLNFYRR